ncbi:MAG: Gfo/Idh/MocA family oxidoreductase [Planctomycetota bacterium]
MREEQRFSRRRLLKGAAAAGAAAVMPAIVPAAARGRGGRIAPSERIRMGFIGVGSQGRSNMNWFLGKPEVQVLAVCDVDRSHREAAKAVVDRHYGSSDCGSHLDFHALLGRGDLDAVALALPDQWHAIPAIAAARAGLDIFGEKPLARSIRESRAISDAVRRYGCVWQTGSWQRSVPHFRQAAELVRAGILGRVHHVDVGLPTGRAFENRPPRPVPADLDWDRWLGPAPWRPYCEFGSDKCHWDWRWILDFSGGQLTDWAGHHIDIAHWGLGYDRTGPIEVEGTGEYPPDGLWDAPTAYDFTCRYESGVTIRVANDQRMGFMGTKWFGEAGWIYVDRGGSSASDPGFLAPETLAPRDYALYPGNEERDHVDNFLDCVRSRRETITPVETACRSISVGHLGEIAMLTGRRVRWNPATEEILDDPAASALLGRAYREPWVL